MRCLYCVRSVLRHEQSIDNQARSDPLLELRPRPPTIAPQLSRPAFPIQSEHILKEWAITLPFPTGCALHRLSRFAQQPHHMAADLILASLDKLPTAFHSVRAIYP
jgi:hypothetical protein